MSWEWLERLQTLAHDNVPHALVTITQVSGSAPREPGAKMIVLEDGRFFGTVGGGQLETLVIADARASLHRRKSGTFRYPLAAKAAQCCGGSVEVFIEALGARPELFVFGAGHVGQAVAHVLQGTPFVVHLIDERPEWIAHAALPKQVITHPLPWDAALHELHFDAKRSHAVVMTHRHDHDQDIIEALLQRPLASLGLIGSRAKWERFRSRLGRRGVSAEALARVRCPIGLPIGGKAPQEVAISLAAELLRMHRRKTTVVLLAGGESKRMGQAKGLLEINGTPLLLAQVDALEALGASVTVVTGRHHDAYSALLADRDVHVVRNPAPQDGPFSSLQCGLRAHRGPAFMLPLDVPCPSAPVWHTLAATSATAAVPEHAGRGGHPVYLSAELVQRCLRLPSTSRLDHLLRDLEDVARVPVDDPAVLTNLNTPDDLAVIA